MSTHRRSSSPNGQRRSSTKKGLRGLQKSVHGVECSQCPGARYRKISFNIGAHGGLERDRRGSSDSFSISPSAQELATMETSWRNDVERAIAAAKSKIVRCARKALNRWKAACAASSRTFHEVHETTVLGLEERSVGVTSAGRPILQVTKPSEARWRSVTLRDEQFRSIRGHSLKRRSHREV